MLRPTLGISPRHRADKPMPTVISYERYCYGANYSFHWLVCPDGTNCQQIRLVLSCHSLERKREARQPPKAVLFAHIRARGESLEPLRHKASVGGYTPVSVYAYGDRDGVEHRVSRKSSTRSDG
uniref:p019 n=1 Tax=Proteus mirabilis TaxID=584 RepID=A0A075TFA1_PROMI|nr:P019 [Proteus mirabilis]AIG56619.1 P019 [Proteus mirabilis]ANA09807.1 hypothetical protein [Proteus mirabilis]